MHAPLAGGHVVVADQPVHNLRRAAAVLKARASSSSIFRSPRSVARQMAPGPPSFAASRSRPSRTIRSNTGLSGSPPFGSRRGRRSSGIRRSGSAVFTTSIAVSRFSLPRTCAPRPHYSSHFCRTFWETCQCDEPTLASRSRHTSSYFEKAHRCNSHHVCRAA